MYAADIWVRPTNGNDGNAGTSYVTAFKTLQHALDTAVAGQVIGTCAEADEVLTATVDDDTNAGSASAQTEIVALNASGERDGTRYVLDGNNAVVNCFRAHGAAARYKNIIGLEFKNATGAGFISATTNISLAYTLYNCHSHNNGGAGFDSGVANTYVFFNNCAAYSNGSHGFACTASEIGPKIRCSAFLNGGSGFYFAANAQQFFGCLAYKNTVAGFEGTSGRCTLVGCTIDGNVIGIKGASTTLTILSSRITNNSSFAIQLSTGSIRENYNYFYGNNGGGAKFDYTTGGVSSGVFSVDMATAGYVDQPNNNYALKNGAIPAEGRWVAREFNSSNTDYVCAGMNPNPDFSLPANTLPADTTDGNTGTFDEAARNKFAVGTDASSLLTGKSVKLLNVDYDGTYAGASVPDAVEISTADGISPTAIRVNFLWEANAANIYIERATSAGGSYSQIANLTSGNYFDDTVTAGQVWYYRARGYNAAGYGAYGDVVEGTARTSAQIEQALWTLFQTKMQADAYLFPYIGKWKFNKEEAILPATKFPIFKAWILSTREQWISAPKRKIVIPRVIIHGLVKSATALEAEKLKMDEYIKNAIEADMTFASGVTMNIIGDTIFNNLDDHTEEVFIECEIMSKVFVAGQR